MKKNKNISLADAPFGLTRSTCVGCGESDDTFRDAGGVVLIICSQTINTLVSPGSHSY